MPVRVLALLVLAVTLSTASRAPVAFAREPAVYTKLVPGVAVGGYDPVAYFTEGRAIEGRADIAADHGGAQYRFSSDANRAAFLADPERYKPRYGGYCAFAVARGATARGDPRAWAIVDGKLYLNLNAEIKALWERDIPAEIKNADNNWPAVLDK